MNRLIQFTLTATKTNFSPLSNPLHWCRFCIRFGLIMSYMIKSIMFISHGYHPGSSLETQNYHKYMEIVYQIFGVKENYLNLGIRSHCCIALIFVIMVKY